MAPRYGIQFYPCGQIYYFTSPDAPLSSGTPVVVDTGHGENLGIVIKIVGDASGQGPLPGGPSPALPVCAPSATPAEVAVLQGLPVYLAEPEAGSAAAESPASGPAEPAASGEVPAREDEANGENEGPELSEVLSQALDPESPNLQPIKRVAGPRDLERAGQNLSQAGKAKKYCMEIAAQYKLDMKLVHAEVSLDGGKLIFFFTAPGRIDFRELVKALARNFHARIELRQIGVRHETQLVGAIGNCGMVCCCRRYMRKFAPVTIKMAKEQGLFLNPVKISGTCGRLLCCLAFEQHNYEEFHGRCPKLGKKYETEQGVFKVLRASLFRNSLSLLPESGDEIEVSLEEWQAMRPVRFDAGRRQKAEKEARQAGEPEGRPSGPPPAAPAAPEPAGSESAASESSGPESSRPESAGSESGNPPRRARARPPRSGGRRENRPAEREAGSGRGRAVRGKAVDEPGAERPAGRDRAGGAERPEPDQGREGRTLEPRADAPKAPPLQQKVRGRPKADSGLSRFLAAASGSDED